MQPRDFQGRDRLCDRRQEPFFFGQEQQPQGPCEIKTHPTSQLSGATLVDHDQAGIVLLGKRQDFRFTPIQPNVRESPSWLRERHDPKPGGFLQVSLSQSEIGSQKLPVDCRWDPNLSQ